MFFKRRQKESNIICFKSISMKVKQHLTHFDNVDFRGAKNKRPLTVNVSSNIRFIRLSLQTESPFHLDTIEIIDASDQIISKVNNTFISSVYNDDDRYSGNGVLELRRNGGCGFHTKREINPWLVIDLGESKDIKQLVIYNRDDIFFTRALSLLVQVGSDMINWQEVHDNLAPAKQYVTKGMSKEEIALAYAGVLDDTKARELIEHYSRKGDYDKALRFHESFNDIISYAGLSLGPYGYTRKLELNPLKIRNNKYNELSYLLTWLNDEFGVAAFIFCETLLGIMTDNKFIGHNNNFKICYVSNKIKHTEILEERKKILSFLTAKGCSMNPSVAAHYRCTMPSGIIVDIFTGFFEQGRCSIYPLRRRGVKTEDVVPVYKQPVQNTELFFPRDPEQLLIFNYGPNWRVPDLLWNLDWTGVRKQYDFLFF